MRIAYLAAVTASLFAARQLPRQPDSVPQGDQFACAIAAGRDLDGDGIPDAVIADATPPGGSSLWIVSGREGSVRLRCAIPNEITGVDLVGDIDGDGLSEIALVTGHWDGPTALELLSGRTGSLIRRDDAACWGVRRLWSVRAAGDVDGDGCPDLLVGCAEIAASGATSGIVLVVSGKDGNLLHRFDGGLACTRLGDVDSDGRSDFAIAYFGRVTSTLRWRPWVASIVVYSGRSGAPAFEILGDSSGRECDLDLDGGNEFDGDGSPDLLVGSHKYNWGSKPSGRVRVDSGRSGNLLSNFDRSSMPERRAFEDDSFGEIVRWSSDLNGDGVPEILVGAPEDGAFEGTAYVLSGRDGKPLHTIEGHCGVLVPGEPDRGDRHVGRTLSRAGDLDRDGVEDFLVGNHPYDLGQFGLVRAFSGASGCLLWSIDRDAVLRSNAKAVSAR